MCFVLVSRGLGWQRFYRERPAAIPFWNSTDVWGCQLEAGTDPLAPSADVWGALSVCC